MRVDVLGPIRVRDDHEIAIERPAQRRILALLALAGGSRVSTEVLIDRFWAEDPPDTARAAVQTHISALRKSVGEGLVITEGYGYRLDLDAHELDVGEFDSLTSQAANRVAAHDWATGLDKSDAALDLWRGNPYSDLADDEFARPEIARLEELHLGLLELRAACLIAIGRELDALADLEALVVEHPYRERLWEHLMTARYRLGRNAEALQAFQQISGHLAEIGLQPGKPLQELEERILLHDQSLIGTVHNLPPQLDEFIGRAAELERVEKLLSTNRLVTLTGAGGSGKTRLAIRTAEQLLDDYEGVHFVELADLDDPSLIPAAIATVLGLTGDGDLMPTLAKSLSSRRALLVVDNCEHLIQGAAQTAAELLKTTAHLRILTTSRQPLRTPGEAVYAVPGLSLEAGSPTEAARSDAVRLFERRALQADLAFELETNLADVVAICRRLDSMPLGIELAAARCSALTVGEINKHLDGSLGLLTSGDSTAHPRHQTLEATIEWSYQLASDDVRRALVVLSVFRGGFDLDMAIWMLGDVAPRLVAELVDQSLAVTYETVSGRRYRILETIRQFAAARARDQMLEESTFRAHAEWCVTFADRIWDSWQKPQFDRVESSIHEEFENLTAAFERADSAGDRSLAGRVAEGLLWHWLTLGHLERALEFFDRALETCTDDDRRVGLLSKGVWPKLYTNRLDEALADAETAYRLGKGLQASEGTAYAVSTKAAMYWFMPDLDGAEGVAYAREAVEVAVETGNDLLIAVLQLDLALALAWAGSTAEARPALESAVDQVERTGDPYTVAYTYSQAVTVAAQIADLRREALADYSHRLREWLEKHPQIAPRFRLGWIEWAMIQAGKLAGIESELREWSREDHYEGFNKVGYLIPLGIAVWMQGRLQEALQIIEECEAEGINPRWFHDFYPLKVDVLVDLGRLDQAEAAAAFYLDYETDPAESAKKLGVLNPLVRGVADLAERNPEHTDLVMRAGKHVDLMRQILAEHPPPMDGTVAMETHTTHLLFAEAELTRLAISDAACWANAMSAADYIYFRLYAQIRLGEALFKAGEPESGRAQADAALAEAQRIGAARLVDLAEAILSR